MLYFSTNMVEFGLSMGSVARNLPILAERTQTVAAINCRQIGELEITDRLRLKLQFSGIDFNGRNFRVANPKGSFWIPGSQNTVYARTQDNQILLLANSGTGVSCEVWLSQLDPDPIYWNNFNIPELAKCCPEIGVTVLSFDVLKLGFKLK